MAHADRNAVEAAFAARLREREAMRLEAAALSTGTPSGLERTLSSISDEVTSEAMERMTRESAELAKRK